MCNCKKTLSVGSFKGDTGVGISLIEVDDNADGFELTVTLTDGSTQGPFQVDVADGTDGTSVDHVEFTSSTGSPSNVPNQPGYIDTYTLWGDVGETINLGTFTVKQGANGTSASVTVANVGSGAGVYISGTDTPFEMRTFTSPDGSISIVENGDEIEVQSVLSNWTEVNNPGGIGPAFSIPPEFTNIGNSTNFNTVAFKTEGSKVIMKGCLQFSGTYTYGGTPTGVTGSKNLTIINSLPSEFDPVDSNGVITTCRLFNPTANHNSSATLLIGSGAVILVIDRRLNYIDANTFVSFEGTSYVL